MLHNPQWERNSLLGLIAWLETQEPQRSYRFTCSGDCLVARYGGAVGIRRDEYSPELHKIYSGTDPLRIGIGMSGDDQTYGAALERARRALAAQWPLPKA